MTSRILSACLGAMMVIGLAAGARAQSTARPGTGPPGLEDGSGGANSSRTGTGPDSKDPFDSAARAKGDGTTTGDSPGASVHRLERATFGAGCFWHVEAEFEWLPGVKSAVSGYAGGSVPNPSYEEVHEGYTGHVEVVQVEYDPAVISYEELLKVFWRGHDPTQWNRQGPDVGTQYRSAIFYHNELQRKAALKSYRELTAARFYRAPIVTLLLPMKAFYRAEEYHQNYYGGKPDRPVMRNSRARRKSKAVGRKADPARASAVKKDAATPASSSAPRTAPAPSPRRTAPGPSEGGR